MLFTGTNLPDTVCIFVFFSNCFLSYTHNLYSVSINLDDIDGIFIKLFLSRDFITLVSHYYFSQYFEFTILSICLLCKGESVTKWRTEEFRMFEGGPLWRPPPVNLFSGGMPEDLVEEDDYPYAPGYVPPPSGRRRESEDL